MGIGLDTTAGPRFLKMHGLGNHFVIIDARDTDAALDPARARAVGDRFRGVGFDQLVVMGQGDGVAAKIDFYNSDGSLADACGNGSRCAARLLMEDLGLTELTIRTGRGDLACRDLGNGQIEVNMGPPETEWHAIPLSQDVDIDALPIEGAPGALGMGNPHCVFDVEDVEAIDLERVGPLIEHHPLFPERTNVEYIQVLDAHTLRLRVWERGVGITQACGSGACAAAVVAARKGLTDRRVTVHLDGGPLRINWTDEGVKMIGPTAKVFEGRFAPEFWENGQ